MKAQHSYKKNRDGYPRSASMGAQTPKAAGGSVPFRPAEAFCISSTANDVESMAGVIDATTTASPRHPSESANYEGEQYRQGRNRSMEREESSNRAIPEQLADLLMNIIPGMEGAELGEAFQYAADLPPVTKQSLGELDVQNIIANIKLRHDVNFDKDLSFRPNLDGPKGQEKRRHSDMYWRSLVAELELYARLFQGTPSAHGIEGAEWSTFVQHIQRRIPKVFRTLHEILESLVPERDHQRLNEHFDGTMLMQEIERGVCDLVKRVEWVATLLKEHCAPMRDGLVDKMVQTTTAGVATNNTAHIVSGLKELLGILEAMKLDVANHQIRNLKTLLIEDTVNFEKHYHLDRLVRGRSKVNIDTAQKWWARVGQNQYRYGSTAKDASHSQLETFTGAVVAHLFGQDNQADLPDTFHLDADRLRVLKSEIDDLVHFEICFDMFGQCLKEFAYVGPVPNTARSELRNALSAIIGEHAGHSPESWLFHSESLSLEIYRQAILLAGRPFVCDSHELRRASQHLQKIFQHYFSSYASKVQAVVLSQVMTCSNRHYNASPIELFNSLVTPTSSASMPFVSMDPQSPVKPTVNTLSYFADRLIDLTYRIAHITLLHWRIWGSIAYLTDDSHPQDMIDSPTNSPWQKARPANIHTHLHHKQLSTASSASSSSPSSLHHIHGIAAPTPPPTLHASPPVTREVPPTGTKRGKPTAPDSDLGDDPVKTKHHRFERK